MPHCAAEGCDRSHLDDSQSTEPIPSLIHQTRSSTPPIMAGPAQQAPGPHPGGNRETQEQADESQIELAWFDLPMAKERILEYTETLSKLRLRDCNPFLVH